MKRHFAGMNSVICLLIRESGTSHTFTGINIRNRTAIGQEGPMAVRIPGLESQQRESPGIGVAPQ